MSTKSKLQRSLIVAVMLVLVSAAALFGLSWAVRYTQASVAALAEAISASATHQTSDALLTRRVEETKQERGQLDAHFIAVSDLVPFLEKIEELAHIAGVSSKVAAVSEETRPLEGTAGKGTNATYGVISIRVTFEGAWAQVYRFASLIEHMPYANRIEHLELSEQSATTEKRADWEGSIVFTVAKLP